jgi:hypothetical protein
MVIVLDGRRVEIDPGRLAALVQWLVTHRERFEHQEKVQVTFDCAGDRAIAVVKERVDVDPATAARFLRWCDHLWI